MVPQEGKANLFFRSSQPYTPKDISNENRAEDTLRGCRYNCIIKVRWEKGLKKKSLLCHCPEGLPVDKLFIAATENPLTSRKFVTNRKEGRRQKG